MRIQTSVFKTLQYTERERRNLNCAVSHRAEVAGEGKGSRNDCFFLLSNTSIRISQSALVSLLGYTQQYTLKFFSQPCGLSWFNVSWQLSTTQLLAHCLPVDGERIGMRKVRKNSWVETKTV